MKQIFDNRHYMLLDGAMGTMLQKSGLKLGERPELLSITHPKEVERINRAYVQAGSDLICANTFGANAKKLAGCGYSVQEVIFASVAAAKRAASGTNTKVMLDVGPIGELLEPAGTLQFEQAYDIYREVVVAGAQAGADLVKFATMTDLYELKAAILAAKENTDLPILTAMTFEANGRTFTGCTVESFAMLAEGMGVDGIGINCSLGPDEIYPIAKRLCESTNLPVFIKPNAGLPDPETGTYNISPEEFCAAMEKYKDLGICAVGGCCGTSPEYLALLKRAFKDETPKKRPCVTRSSVCSPTRTVLIDNVRVIGERINPTGKKRFKEALKNKDMDYLLAQAVEQASAGADILDVNVGLPEIDEKEMMVKAVKAIQSVCELPLQLDSTKADVLEAGLRVYNGKPIVNSVNAEDSVLHEILPLCKKYGAAVVGLTLSSTGIPAKAEERFAYAQKIVNAAEQIGIPRSDVYIDCLTLTACAQQDSVIETLKALKMVKEQLGVKTVLGVSNISFGLPRREFINTSFLTLALAHGLDLPIMNPNTESMMAAVASYRVLYNIDKGSEAYLNRYASTTSASTAVPSKLSLYDAILQGLKTQAAQAAQEDLKNNEPEALMNTVLIPALDKVGNEFEKGTLFLPQLLRSAAAAQAAFDIVKNAIAATGNKREGYGKILLATVHGDIHDIGKNIVKTLLENYGYDVIDLGRDVPAEDIVKMAIEQDVPLIGLSALMTTTLVSMEETIQALHKSGHNCKIMVGGAVLTREYAHKIGADYYAEDAKQSIDIARTVFG